MFLVDSHLLCVHLDLNWIVVVSQIFTNFLSSMMIHATKPFVESERIQTKIQGQEVTGTVEVL